MGQNIDSLLSSGFAYGPKFNAHVFGHKAILGQIAPANPDAQSENSCAGYFPNMINAVEVHNFRCFEKLEVSHLKRINLIVGDNGAGKTAFLEAIFLAMGETTELVSKYRQFRGVDGNFLGDRPTVERSLVGDMFYNQDMEREIRVKLMSPDDDRRQVFIGKNRSQQSSKNINANSLSIVFRWTDHTGLSREVPLMGGVLQGQMQFLGTGEEINRFSYMPANVLISQAEVINKFSDLVKSNLDKAFVEAFTNEFNNITDIQILVDAGSPILYATMKNSNLKIPVANTSGAISRIMSLLLSLNRKRNIVLIDESDNGVFHARYESICRTIISFARKFETQIFMSTHNDVWLKAFVKAAGKKLDDVSLIRIEKRAGEHTAVQFDGDDLAAGIELGAEVR